MRKKLNITEGIFPMPVLMVATYNEDGSINVMNAAWGTMQERDTVALNLTETHKTVQNIKARGAFTVSIADAAHVTEADYFGVESGNREPTSLNIWQAYSTATLPARVHVLFASAMLSIFLSYLW